MSNIYTTRFTLDKVISVGWEQYIKNFSNILVIVFLVYIPVNLAMSYIPWTNLSYLQDYNQFRSYTRLIQVMEIFVGIIATMSVAILTEASLNGHLSLIHI